MKITNEYGFKDHNGKLYTIGDIVYNPCIGDFWVVRETTEEDKNFYKLEDELCLALYDDKEYYVMDITEPAGFTIFLSPDDEHYSDAYKEIRRILEQRKKYEESLKKENKDE